MPLAIIDLLKGADILIYPLALCSLVLVYILCERSCALRRSAIIPDDMADAIVAGQAMAGGEHSVLGRIVRLMGQGNPEMEAIADLLSPPTDQEATPQQMQQALQQLKGENEQIKQVAQRLAQELKSKMPELEYKRWSD